LRTSRARAILEAKHLKGGMTRPLSHTIRLVCKANIVRGGPLTSRKLEKRPEKQGDFNGLNSTFITPTGKAGVCYLRMDGPPPAYTGAGSVHASRV
jgi:hypothetical protein